MKNENIGTQTMYVPPGGLYASGTDRMVVVTGGNVWDYDLHALGKKRFTVGRSGGQADITIPSPGVSSPCRGRGQHERNVSLQRE